MSGRDLCSSAEGGSTLIGNFYFIGGHTIYFRKAFRRSMVVFFLTSL